MDLSIATPAASFTAHRQALAQLPIRKHGDHYGVPAWYAHVVEALTFAMDSSHRKEASRRLLTLWNYGPDDQMPELQHRLMFWVLMHPISGRNTYGVPELEKLLAEIFHANTMGMLGNSPSMEVWRTLRERVWQAQKGLDNTHHLGAELLAWACTWHCQPPQPYACGQALRELAKSHDAPGEVMAQARAFLNTLLMKLQDSAPQRVLKPGTLPQKSKKKRRRH
jgi:hypothetical protein